MEPTINPAIATITAAFIAGAVAFVSSVLSKEQKTSEFRYSWLNAVLDDIAKFTGATESISASAWSIFKAEGKEKAQAFLGNAEPQIRDALAAYYRARIRLYPTEHARVLAALDPLRAILLESTPPDPVKIDPLIQEAVHESHEALKREWGRIKVGEPLFVWTRWISFSGLSLALLVAIGFAALRFFQ